MSLNPALLSLQYTLCNSIGLHVRLHPMLEVFMASCCDVLNLTGTHLYTEQALPIKRANSHPDNDFGLTHYLSIPTNPAPHQHPEIAKTIKKQWASPSQTSARQHQKNAHYHLFKLDDLGIFILECGDTALSDDIETILITIMNRLLIACRICLEHEQCITERKQQIQAKQALKNSETHLLTLFKNVNDGIISINGAGEIESLTPSLLSIFGYQEDELIGQNISILIPPQLKTAHSQGLQRYLDSKSAHIVGKGIFELPAQHKDGHEFPIELTIGEMRLDNTAHFIGILRDISQRKQNEEALNRAHKYTTDLLENTLDIFLLIDHHARLTYINRRAEERFKHRREELLGKTLDEALPGLSHHFSNILKHVVQTDQTDNTNEIYPMLGRWFESRAFVTSDGLGIYLHDVTEQKQAEDAMQKAYDAALETSRAKSAFLASMSHEIRTPMNGVLGMLELLSDSEALDAEHKEFAQTAYRSGEQLMILLNDILDFSKIEAGKLSLENLEIGVKMLILDTCVLYKAQANKKGLSILSEIADDVPAYINGDPTRLRQIINNLTSNAIKFTTKGNITLRVTMVSAKNNAPRIQFEIIDTGIGIPLNAQNNIFDHFTQADETTTRKYGGTGLGLAICRRLAHAMGSEIKIDSVPERGSRFYFSLALN